MEKKAFERREKNSRWKINKKSLLLFCFVVMFVCVCLSTGITFAFFFLASWAVCIYMMISFDYYIVTMQRGDAFKMADIYNNNNNPTLGGSSGHCHIRNVQKVYQFDSNYAEFVT